MVDRRTDVGELARQLGTSPPFRLPGVARAPRPMRPAELGQVAMALAFALAAAGRATDEVELARRVGLWRRPAGRGVGDQPGRPAV